MVPSTRRALQYDSGQVCNHRPHTKAWGKTVYLWVGRRELCAPVYLQILLLWQLCWACTKEDVLFPDLIWCRDMCPEVFPPSEVRCSPSRLWSKGRWMQLWDLWRNPDHRLAPRLQQLPLSLWDWFRWKLSMFCNRPFKWNEILIMGEKSQILLNAFRSDEVQRGIGNVSSKTPSSSLQFTVS